MLYTFCDVSRAITLTKIWITKPLLHAYIDIMAIIYFKFHEILSLSLGVALTRMYGKTG